MSGPEDENMISPDGDSFVSRVKEALKVRFDPKMSRAILLAALFEADRCLVPRYTAMRPFQRKIALVETALDLIQTLDFLSEDQRAGLICKTQKGPQRPLVVKMASKRFENLKDDIEDKIYNGIEEVSKPGMTHNEICDEFIRNHFTKFAKKRRSCPPLWEYVAFPIFLTYRVFYRGTQIDPAIFPAVPPRIVDVPAERTANPFQYAFQNWMNSKAGVDHLTKCDDVIANDKSNAVLNSSNLGKTGGGQQVRKAQQRKRLQHLMEVKVRMDLLNEMEGILPEQEIINRKRSLLLSMPPIPTDAKSNRMAYLSELKIRVELLKETNGVLPEKRIVHMKRSLFRTLPPFPMFLKNWKSDQEDGKENEGMNAEKEDKHLMSVEENKLRNSEKDGKEDGQVDAKDNEHFMVKENSKSDGSKKDGVEEPETTENEKDRHLAEEKEGDAVNNKKDGNVMDEEEYKWDMVDDLVGMSEGMSDIEIS